jgi:hypothetical protein
MDAKRYSWNWICWSSYRDLFCENAQFRFEFYPDFSYLAFEP